VFVVSYKNVLKNWLSHVLFRLAYLKNHFFGQLEGQLSQKTSFPNRFKDLTSILPTEGPFFEKGIRF